MHPNSVTPPRIETYDRDIPLIEQIDGFHWPAFENQTRHAFHLSGWHISFCGNLMDYPYGGTEYASFQTDITCDNSYRRYAGEMELWNEKTPELRLELANLHFYSHIYIGERHFAQVGETFLNFKVVRVRRPLLGNLGDLRDSTNLKKYLVKNRERMLIRELSDEERWSFPRRPEDVELEEFNQRQWAKAAYTHVGNHSRYIYITALDDSHILELAYDPIYWPLEYNNYSEKAKALVLEPLYDFMEHCHIEYSENPDIAIGRFEPESSGEDEQDENSW